MEDEEMLFFFLDNLDAFAPPVAWASYIEVKHTGRQEINQDPLCNLVHYIVLLSKIN